MVLLHYITVSPRSRRLQSPAPPFRCLEIRLPGSGLERGPGCHPERSEGSLRPSSQTLRFAQGDRPYLQTSRFSEESLTRLVNHAIFLICRSLTRLVN